MKRRYDSFGLNSAATQDALSPRDAIDLIKRGDIPAGSLLGYGQGRSYGDSCQNVSGKLVDMRPMNRILSFDPDTGLLEAEAGAMLCELIAHVEAQGWFPPVLPGTRFVTLAGAIANDIHGKNHHRRGTFGCHVEEFALLRSDGHTYRCSRTANPGLFAATIGGMGLTGLILSASIRLHRVSSPAIQERATPFHSLDAYFGLAEEADLYNEYAVAWIDQLATDRGILITGNHAGREDDVPDRRRHRLSVPFRPPFNVLNRPFLRTFNGAYFRSRSRAGQPRVTGHGSFFFPLDGVRHWNRLYGPGGLFQHQSVLPQDSARAAVGALLATSREAGQGSFLTVLKRFGTAPSPGLLSFPRPGYTLTLDFPNRGERTTQMLERLDSITIGAGGAVNPYKDARMKAATFAASFPNWRELESWRDPAFLSDFWRRTALAAA